MLITTSDCSPSENIYSRIEARLWQERERIYAEIHTYPPPIPACDAQFNYLIEKRALITQELSRVPWNTLATQWRKADEPKPDGSLQ